MQRRGFLAGLVATAGGLWLPYEPVRVYSFIRPLRRDPVLRLYRWPKPRTADEAIAAGALLLAEIPLSRVGGRWTGSDFCADNSGEVSFGRLSDAYGDTVLDMSREQIVCPRVQALAHVSVDMNVSRPLDRLLTG